MDASKLYTLQVNLDISQPSLIESIIPSTKPLSFVLLYIASSIFLDVVTFLLFNPNTLSLSCVIYTNLTTNLSKLIYIYLKFKLTNDYTLFDNTIPLSDDNNVLENFYESFIVDTIFTYLSSFGT